MLVNERKRLMSTPLFKQANKMIEEKTNQFMEVHHQRLGLEGKFMEASMPFEMNIEEYLNKIDLERQILNDLIALMKANQGESPSHLESIFNSHHTLIKKFSPPKKRFPKSELLSEDRHAYEKKIYHYMRHTRIRKLENEITKIQSRRFNLEADLINIPSKEIIECCKKILTLMRHEVELKKTHWEFDKSNQSASLSTESSHITIDKRDPLLMALEGKKIKLPEVPTQSELFNEETYAVALAHSVLKAHRTKKHLRRRASRSKLKSLPQTVRQANDSEHDMISDNPLPKSSVKQTHQPIRNLPLAVKSGIHALIGLGLAMPFMPTWPLVIMTGLCCLLGSLSYQFYLKPRITNWYSQTQVHEGQFKASSFKAQAIQAGRESIKSNSNYLKSWVQPSAYLLPYFYYGQATYDKESNALENNEEYLASNKKEKSVPSPDLSERMSI